MAVMRIIDYYRLGKLVGLANRARRENAVSIEDFWLPRKVVAGATALSALTRFARDLVAQREENGRWRVRKDFKMNYLFTLFMLLSLGVLNPVDVATKSDRSSVELFYRVVSPAYPPAGGGSETEDSAEDTTGIAVILINDETLRAFGKTWPPPLSFHAEVLDKILGESAPKALFVDFGFFDERDEGEVDKLADALRRYASPISEFPRSFELWGEAKELASDSTAGGVTPVFLAAAPKGLKVLGDLKNAVTGTVSTRHPLAHEVPYNTYPLLDCHLKKPSAALAMYAGENHDRLNLGVTDCLENGLSMAGANQLSIFWASWGSKREGRGIYPCRDLPGTVMGRIGQIFKIWYFELMGRADAWSHQFQICPPHLAISAHDILNDDGGYAALLVDRYVFYGGNFAMADDLIEAPAHRPIPGVFLHAMALDNLLREQLHVHRAEGIGPISGPAVLNLGAAVVAVFLIVLAWAGLEKLLASERIQGTSSESPAPQSAPSSNGRKCSEVFPTNCQILAGTWWAALMTLSVSSVIAVVWLAFSVLQWAPINFVGLFTFMALHSVATTARQVIAGLLS